MTESSKFNKFEHAVLVAKSAQDMKDTSINNNNEITASLEKLEQNPHLLSELQEEIIKKRMKNSALDNQSSAVSDDIFRGDLD